MFPIQRPQGLKKEEKCTGTLDLRVGEQQVELT